MLICLIIFLHTAKLVADTPVERSRDVDALYVEVMNFYVKGNYLRAAPLLKDLHTLAPAGYKDSKEIEWLVNNMVRSHAKSPEQRRDELNKIEPIIRANVKKCEPMANAGEPVARVRDCLKEAIALGPDHPLVVELVTRAQRKK